MKRIAILLIVVVLAVVGCHISVHHQVGFRKNPPPEPATNAPPPATNVIYLQRGSP